jgi:hypothetical protein
MRERQILFSAPMVCAIRDGRKTQTRRVVMPQPEVSDAGNLTGEWLSRPLGGLLLPKPQDIVIHCPYGQEGDRLSVRETFFAYGRWGARYSAKKGHDEWHFVDMTIECDRAYRYAADDPDVPLAGDRAGVLPGWWKRPAIFMPRTASRITLEVTSVRVERLQEISEADAIAEGVGLPMYEADESGPTYACAYRHLWDRLNAARGFGWDASPWVWCISFRRIS